MAANQLEASIQPLLARGILLFRPRLLFPFIANNRIETTPGSKGSEIYLDVISDLTPTAVVPAHTAPDTQALITTKKAIKLDQWEENAFTLTDQELMQISMGIIPRAADRAVVGLAKSVDTQVARNVLKAPYVNGTAGTTPFAVNATTGLNDMSAFINARKALNARDVDEDGRVMVVDGDASGNLFSGRQFVDASFRGDQGGIVAGTLGTKWNTTWIESNRVLTNTSTALTAGALTVSGVNASGATSVLLAKATTAAPLKAGDILTIGSGSAAGTYRVAADVTLIVGNTVVTLTTGLLGATAGGEAVTLTGTAVNNFLMTQDAIGFVSRPLGDSVPPSLGGLGLFDYITDPLTGLSLRLEITREHKQYRFSYDFLWGSDLINPKAIQVVLG